MQHEKAPLERLGVKHEYEIDEPEEELAHA
jgi:hypothetical protein